MALMQWNPQQFDVHVPKMNTQHENLVRLMNQLYDQHQAGARKPELDALLIKLRDLTVQHFNEEEAFLDSIGYPGASTHKKIHQELVTNFGQHYRAFAAGSGEISSDFFGFLKLWLTAHIQHVDRKYGEFSKG